MLRGSCLTKKNDVLFNENKEDNFHGSDSRRTPNLDVNGRDRVSVGCWSNTCLPSELNPFSVFSGGSQLAILVEDISILVEKGNVGELLRVLEFNVLDCAGALQIKDHGASGV